METPTADRELGTRLRRHRTAQGRSLTEVAGRAGVSKGFLSQLERGRSRASVVTLRRLAAVLDLSLTDLLTEAGPPEIRPLAPYVTRHPGPGTGRLLTPEAATALRVLDSVVPAGAASRGAVLDPRPTTHFLLVRSGRFTLQTLGTPYRLGAGDTLTFNSPPAYSWRNEGSEPTRLVWALVSHLAEA